MPDTLDTLTAILGVTLMFIAEHPLQIAAVSALVFVIGLAAVLFAAPELVAPRTREHPDAD